jgi:hypothetical protein
MSVSQQTRDRTRLVRELIAGKPLSDLSSDELLDLRDVLQSSRDRAISLGQFQRLRAIHRIMTHIRGIERNEKRKSETSPAAPADSPPPEDLDALVTDLLQMHGLDSVESSQLPLVIDHLKTRIPGFVTQNDFDSARNWSNLRRSCELEMKSRSEWEFKMSKHHKAMAALENAEQRIEELRSSFTAELALWESSVATALDEIQRHNQEELDQFDQISEGPMPPFCKGVSPSLQELRETQRQLILSQRYREAGLLFEVIQKKAAYEAEVLQDKHLRSREAQRDALLIDHQQKIEGLISKSEADRIRIIQTFETRLRSLEIVCDNLERRLAVDVFPPSETLSNLHVEGEGDWNFPPLPKRSAQDRKLSRRRSWSLNFRRDPREPWMTEMDLPHWKRICQSRKLLGMRSGHSQASRRDQSDSSPLHSSDRSKSNSPPGNPVEAPDSFDP